VMGFQLYPQPFNRPRKLMDRGEIMVLDAAKTGLFPTSEDPT
jgi:hypothetical protein